MGTRGIRYGVLVIAVLVATFAFARRALACENEVIATLDDSVGRLKRAQAALEDDDLEEARKLAAAVLHDGNPRYATRAHRILALAHARDPRTDVATLVDDAVVLKGFRRPPERTQALSPEALIRDLGGPSVRLALSPEADTEWAEVVARIPVREAQEEAYRVLRELAQRDLIGSAYAYAALARLATVYGDDDTLKTANRRCWDTARDRRICSGAAPRPAFLRGRPEGFALGLFPVLAMLLVKRVLRRRAMLPRFQWVELGCITAAAVLLYWRASDPSVLTLIGVAALVALPSLVERRLLDIARDPPVRDADPAPTSPASTGTAASL